MMTKSNKAFDRYFKVESEDARMVYQSNRKNVILLKKTESQSWPWIDTAFLTLKKDVMFDFIGK